MSDFLVTAWTIACQAPLPMGFFQARILEWVAISFFGGSFQPKDWTQISCTGRQILPHCAMSLLLSWLLALFWFLHYNNRVCVLVTHSCLTLCDPMDCSSPGSSVHGILWASILERVAIAFSRDSSLPRDQTRVSCIGRWIPYHLSHQRSP